MMLTFSLEQTPFTTVMENLYSLKGIKSVTVVILTLPSTRLNGAPVAGKISTSIAVTGVMLASQDKDTSLSSLLIAIRFTGAEGTGMDHSSKMKYIVHRIILWKEGRVSNSGIKLCKHIANNEF